MFKAVKFRKVRLKEGLEELRCAEIFKLDENFLTAAVFSRLLYMPSEALSALLLRGIDVKLGTVTESAFWPRLRLQSKTADTYVEPDLYIRSETLDLIVEAKPYDHPASQRPEQWAQEWAAWHQSDYFDPEKPVLLLAIGGLGTAPNATMAQARNTGETANRLLLSEFPEVPVMQAAGVSWRELYVRLTTGNLADLIQPQLLRDIREILDYFGLRTYQDLVDLGKKMTGSKSTGIDLQSLVVLRSWETALRAPDWLQDSRLFRPISASSIATFRRMI